MMPFGSVFANFSHIEFTTADEKYVNLKNNFITKIGFKVLGLPHIGMRLRARKVLKNLPKIAGKVLDAGCGTGVYSFTLQKRFEKIFGVDIEDKKINYVNAVNKFDNILFEKGDLRKMKFKDNEFDLIICSDVIEHIKEDQKAFSEIARVLKKEGVLKLTVPYDSPSNALDYKKYGHERPGYSEKMVESMCKKNGLKITNIEYYSYPLTEKFSEINYKIVDNKILLGILFYPLYFSSILADKFRIGTPNGISFEIVKNN